MRRLAVCGLALSLLLVAAVARGARQEVSPGISLAFGPGWTVCDGGGALVHRMAGIERRPCGRNLGPGQMMLYYTASGEPIDLWINHIDNPTASENMLEAASAEDVRKT